MDPHPIITPPEGLRPADVAAVLLVAALLLLPGLGNHDLWAPDEPTYAQVSREMIRGGDWLLPHINGRIYTDKPPGQFWLMAALSVPGGDVTAQTARLPSAMAGVALLMVLAIQGGALFGRRAGLLAPAVLASCYLFLRLARSAHLDTLLTLLITVSLFAAWRVMSEGGGVGHRLLFWTAMGAAVLVKGPVGLILPLLVVIVDALVARQPAALLRLGPGWGLPLAVAIPLLWLGLATFLRPDYQPLAALDRHVLQRFTEGVHHSRPFWFPARHLLSNLAPWSVLIPALVVFAARLRHRAGEVEREDEEMAGRHGRQWVRVRFLLVWVITILVFFSLSVEKRGLYLLPILPAAALLFAVAWSAWSARPDAAGAGWGRWGLLLAAVTLVALAVALPLLAPRFEEFAFMLPSASMMAVACGGGGLLMLILLLRRQLRWVLATLAATVVALFLVLIHVAQPALDQVKSPRYLAAEVARHVRPGDAAGMLRWRAGYLYYSGVRLEELDNDNDALELMSRPGRCLVLLHDQNLIALSSRLGPVEVLADQRVGHKRMLLVARENP